MVTDQKAGRNSEKYKIQDEQYQFPYHYIPYLDDNGIGNRIRIINNGFEYLCYVKHVVDLVKEIGFKNILEVGCGDGRVMNFLNSPDSRGVDLSEKGIKFARAFNPSLEFMVGDAGDITEVFSIVMAIEVLEHIPEEIIPQFWNTLYDRCERKGNIVISVPSVNKSVIKKHFRHYDLDRLHQELEMAGLNKKLKIDKVQYLYREDKVIKLWKRFSNNKYWVFESHYLRVKIWKHIWNNLRIADINTGYHIVAVLNKIG